MFYSTETCFIHWIILCETKLLQRPTISPPFWKMADEDPKRISTRPKRKAATTCLDWFQHGFTYPSERLLHEDEEEALDEELEVSGKLTAELKR